MFRDWKVPFSNPNSMECISMAKTWRAAPSQFQQVSLMTISLSLQQFVFFQGCPNTTSSALSSLCLTSVSTWLSLLDDEFFRVPGYQATEIIATKCRCIWHHAPKYRAGTEGLMGKLGLSYAYETPIAPTM